MSDSSTSSTNAKASRQIGIVKWFDTKKGFGMITTMGDLYKNKDIFAHHTEVIVKTPQYKYLIAGEYVSYDVNDVGGGGGEAKLTAVNIKGVLNGPVMCETLNTEKLLKNAYNAKRRQEYSSSNQNSRTAEEVEPKRNIKETAKEPVAKETATKETAKETVVKPVAKPAPAPKVKEVKEIKEKKPSAKKNK